MSPSIIEMQLEFIDSLIEKTDKDKTLKTTSRDFRNAVLLQLKEFILIQDKADKLTEAIFLFLEKTNIEPSTAALILEIFLTLNFFASTRISSDVMNDIISNMRESFSNDSH